MTTPEWKNNMRALLRSIALRPGVEFAELTPGKRRAQLVMEDYYVTSQAMPYAQWTEQLRNHYRVEIFPDGHVETVRLPGPVAIDSEVLRTYSDISELPDWMQRRVAVLRTVHLGQQPMPRYEGVGIRVDENVFWVEQGKDDA